MSSATASLDFIALAQELNLNNTQIDRPATKELIPAEAFSRMQREGQGFMQAPIFKGSTVDQEGLTNNYGIEPEMYFATVPNADQARNYLYQGFAAAALVITLMITSALVS